MAPPNEVAGLTEELILSICQFDKASQAFRRLRETTSRRLRHHNYARTNQFEVASKLEGLQEKFVVLDREDLADAVRSSLHELSGISTKWTPDSLALLLELSDQPVNNSKVEDLEKLRRLDLPPPLTWAEIEAADPLDRTDGVWQDVDFTMDSSEEEISLSSTPSYPRFHVKRSNLEDGDQSHPDPDVVLETDDVENVITSIFKAQFWKATAKSQIHLTELQASRETVFMLRGLPTSIYWRVGDGIEIDKRFLLRNSSPKTFHNLLQSFGELGQRLDRVRSYAKITQIVPSLQTFRSGLEDCLAELDGHLNRLESDLLIPEGKITVSLIQLYQDIYSHSQQLLQLSDLVGRISSDDSIACLESLYDLTCSNQVLGTEDIFSGMAKLFLRCFETFSRPLRSWIGSGRLEPTNESFFIMSTTQDANLGKLWHEWFKLKRSGRRSPDAPHFLQPVAETVLKIGKSLVFLRHLGEVLDESLDMQALPMWIELNSLQHSNVLVPFAESFGTTISAVIDARHVEVSERLRYRIDQRCGLWRTLDAMDYCYFSKDIAIMSNIERPIFERIDKCRSDWNDRFLVKEVALGAFGAAKAVDLDYLVVRTSKRPSTNMCDVRQSVQIMGELLIDYDLSWPLRNIFSQDCLSVFRRLASFLAQIRRARYELERTYFQSKTNREHHIQSARQHLHLFVNCLYDHITSFVLATARSDMRHSLAKALDLDDMISIQSRYAIRLEDQCLISAKLRPIHHAVIAILNLSIKFSDLFIENQVNDIETTRKHKGNGDSQAQRLRSSVESDDESADDDEPVIVQVEHKPISEEVKKIRSQFNQHFAFVIAGLRGVGRAGEHGSSWEILADKLDWNQSSGYR